MADVSTPSAEYDAMSPYWDKVTAILGGTDAMRKQTKFLPQFPNETAEDYKFRRENAKFTNIWRDIVENLAAKPFAQTLTVKEDTPDDIKALVEDIDGQGNHLHVFGAASFFNGLANAIEYILVDYPPKAEGTVTVADERAANMRPYWVPISATSMLSIETSKVGGKRVISHCRFRDDKIEREGYEEKTTQRIREFNLEDGAVTFKVHEKRKDSKWEMVEEGSITLNEIPVVPFISGRAEPGSFIVKPMLQDAADLQMELYQQESALKYAKDNTAFPMLAGNGVQPPVGEDGKPAPVPVGPKTVLYAPPNGENAHGEWTFIEPSAQSLKFLAEDIQETKQDLRELGRQPLTAQTGNLTVVTTAFAASKGNSAVMAAAINFKDALENALRLTALWQGREETPEVEIFTDFDVELNDDKGPQTLADARRNGDLSQDTYWEELQRRNVLGPNFDPEQERERLLEEFPGDDTEGDQIDANAA